jgi:hypothetical protein
MADTFSVHIGGGLYLDSSGDLTFGPPGNAQVYGAPGGFHLDTKKVQETFKDLSGLLPKDEAAQKKWLEWGVPKELVDTLAKVAGAAGIVASAVSIYAWAIGVLLTIMDLVAGADGMSPELATTLYSIKNQLRGGELLDRADRMIQMHSEFDGRIDELRGKLNTIAVENPAPARRAELFGQMQSVVDELSVPLSRLRDQEWATTYERDFYKGRAFASARLVAQKSDGSLAPVGMEPQGITWFDYRLGVPMLLYAATAYTAMAQVAMPWFRSAGTYAQQLRKTADALDRFVLRMQDESLARTEHTAQSILSEQVTPVVDIDEPLPAPWSPGVAAGAGTRTYAVGAFDLVRYDDAFLADRWLAQFQAGVDRGRRGLFDFRWTTSLTDLDEIAAAANDQARQDYANLQAATGMFRLISTAAWLRFLSTPPTSSQTVTGSVSESHVLVDEQPTTATSPPIFPVGVIEHAATLKRYAARGYARISTQMPGFVPQFHYRVVLRTIESVHGKDGWNRAGYIGRVWDTSYEETAGDARLKRLQTLFRPGEVLFERVLYDGPSPAAAAAPVSGQATIRATTYDWYVPVVTPWSRFRPGVEVRKAVEGASDRPSPATTIADGGVSIHLLSDPAATPEMTVRSGAGPFGMGIEDLWLEGGRRIALGDVLPEAAERRHTRVEEVKLEWELTWNADRLAVDLRGDHLDRPFQVHVVVEERVYSGETAPDGVLTPIANDALVEHIHTPFVAELVNQVVLVPEEFFEQEREAIEAGSKLWYDFIRRYSISAAVGPGDPIEHLERSIREEAAQSSSTSTVASALATRAAFAREQAPEIWDSVLQEHGGQPGS